MESNNNYELNSNLTPNNQLNEFESLCGMAKNIEF